MKSLRSRKWFLNVPGIFLCCFVPEMTLGFFPASMLVPGRLCDRLFRNFRVGVRERKIERERERERERDLAHWTVDAVSLARALTVFVRGALHLFVRPMLSSDKATWTSNSYEPNVAPNKLHIPKFLKLNLEFQQSLCIFVFFSLINYFWMISLINLIN